MKVNCSHTQLLDLHKIIPNPKNTNHHPERQIELLAKIIDYTGQRAPIVISNRSGFITKGHARLMAIQKLGWKKAAVDYQDYENEAMEYADLEADNRIAELAQRDEVKFREQASEIFGPDFDMELVAISDPIDLSGWDSDIESIEKVESNDDGIDATIKVTCHKDVKDEVVLFLKNKLEQASFVDVHVK